MVDKTPEIDPPRTGRAETPGEEGRGHYMRRRIVPRPGGRTAESLQPDPPCRGPNVGQGPISDSHVRPGNEIPPNPERADGRAPGRRRLFWSAAVAVVAVLVLAFLVSSGAVPGLGRSGNGDALAVTVQSSASDGYTPFQVTLTASVSGGVPPYAVTWTRPDGTTSTGLSLLLPLATPGGYSVRASASDSTGATASSSATVVAVSPLPGASTLVAAPAGDPNVALALAWRSSLPVSSCILGGWGSLAVPAFETCGGAGGSMHFGTNASGAYRVDPDDPEATPVLFQATQSGIPITVQWWYNGTAGTESFGSTELTTQVAPL